MAILLKNGAVFLHIPKTGGNWITAVLRDLGLVKREVGHKHADITHYFAPPDSLRSPLKHIGSSLLRLPQKKPFMFCFVRDPLSWYESWFKYMSQPGVRWRDYGDAHDISKWHPNAVLNGLGSPDFNQFVRNVVQRRPGYVTELYGWYNQPQMDFTGKQEHLVDDFIRVLGIMNVKFDEEYIRGYKRVGVSPEPREAIAWEYGLKKEVTLYEYAGMVAYGYQSAIIDELRSSCKALT